MLQSFKSLNGAQREPAPEFRVRHKEPLVPSFRYATWRGIQAGRIRVDSTNACHFVFRVRGGFSAQILAAAFDSVIHRHDILNAAVREVYAQPHLWYGRVRTTELETHDLMSLTPEAAQGAARQLATEAVWRPFDVFAGPLHRGFLIKLGETEIVFGMVVHHFISDAVSINVLLQEFIAICCIGARRPDAMLERPILQFSDYVVSLSEWLASAAGVRQLGYWRSRLAGAPPLLLPERSGHASVFQREYFEISSELRVAVEMLARSMNTTSFVVLLAAQKILLAHLTDERDITIGAVTSGREAVGLQSIVGYLADRIYFRTRIDGDPCLSEVVERVRHTVIEASSCKFVRSDFVLEELSNDRVSVSAPIFNMGPRTRRVLPTLNAASARGNIERFEIEPSPEETGPSPGMCYWLMLTGAPSGWSGHVRYSGPVLPKFIPCYKKILQKMVADRDARLTSVMRELK